MNSTSAVAVATQAVSPPPRDCADASVAPSASAAPVAAQEMRIDCVAMVRSSLCVEPLERCGCEKSAAAPRRGGRGQSRLPMASWRRYAFGARASNATPSMNAPPGALKPVSVSKSGKSPASISPSAISSRAAAA